MCVKRYTPSLIICAFLQPIDLLIQSTAGNWTDTSGVCLYAATKAIQDNFKMFLQNSIKLMALFPTLDCSNILHHPALSSQTLGCLPNIQSNYSIIQC